MQAKTKAAAEANAAGAPSAAADGSSAESQQSPDSLTGTARTMVIIANFLVCQNGLAHMFECPLTWWRPPRNFDLEHSMTYMFDPVSQWIALALLWPHLKDTDA